MEGTVPTLPSKALPAAACGLWLGMVSSLYFRSAGYKAVHLIALYGQPLGLLCPQNKQAWGQDQPRNWRAEGPYGQATVQNCHRCTHTSG